MPIAYETSTPRWVGTPADPAAHYATGVQIGMRLGAQQAAQMFQQQQLELQRQHQLMAAQQQEVENQYNTQVLNLKASEMARRHQANQEFRVRVSRGEDPSNVLMQLAPDMGEDPTKLIALQEQSHARRATQAGLQAYRQAQLRKRSPALLEAEDLATTKGLQRGSPEWNQAVADAMEARRGMEEIVTTTPGGGVTITRSSGKRATAAPDALTTANVTANQQMLQSSLENIEAVNRILPLVSSETFGPKAFAESWAKDRFLANFFPDMASGNRVEAAQLGTRLRAKTIRELRSDSNISEKERAEIERAIPEVNNPLDSPANARLGFKSIQRLSAMHALALSKSLKAPLPDESLKNLEDTDLMRAVAWGYLTRDAANSIRSSRNAK